MKRIYTIVTPEGRERVLGVYLTDASAMAAARRRFPADWLALCGVLAQRCPYVGEKLRFGQEWTAEVAS